MRRQLRRLLRVEGGLAALLALAFVVRSARLTLVGAWSGVAEYDDGVHLAAAHFLSHGSLPYRDFVFMHPPAILLLLQPFVGVLHLFGEQPALVVLRLTFVLIGCLNVALVWRLLRVYGLVAAVAGAGFYAVWFPTATSERTALLEPLLNLALLIALLLLRKDSGRHAIAAGAVLGLACTVKLWPAPLVLVLLAWIALERGARRSLQAALGVAASLTLVVGPFFIAAPAAAFHQMISAQAGRERDVSLVTKLRYFDGLHGLNEHQRFVPTVVLLSCAIAVAVLVVLVSRGGGEPAVWAVLLAVGTVELLAAPSFFYHYPAFVGVPLAALLGVAVAAGARRFSVSRVWLLRVGVVPAVLLAFASAGSNRPTAASAEELATVLPDRGCVWGSSSVLLVAERSHDQLECGFEPDLGGVGLTEGSEYVAALTVREFRRGDAAVLLGSLDDQHWSPRVRRAFSEHFDEDGAVFRDGVTVWIARE